MHKGVDSNLSKDQEIVDRIIGNIWRICGYCKSERGKVRFAVKTGNGLIRKMDCNSTFREPLMAGRYSTLLWSTLSKFDKK